MSPNGWVLLLFSTLLFLVEPVKGEISPLGFLPLHAQYSASLGRIILTSAEPNQIHILDPVLLSDITIDLEAPPVALSLAADGRTAAVGHARMVSHVDLSAATVLRTAPTSRPVAQVLLTSTHIFYFSNPEQGGGSIALATGAETLSNSLMLFATLAPEGDALVGVTSFDVGAEFYRAKIKDGQFTGEHLLPIGDRYPPPCGPFWAPPGSGRIYSPCGTVFSDWPASLRYPEHVLSFAKAIISVAERADSAYTAVLHARDASRNQPSDSNLTIYDRQRLQPVGKIELTPFAGSSGPIPALGRWVFPAPTEGVYYVITQAASGEILQGFRLETIDIQSNQPCPATVDVSSMEIEAYSERYSAIASRSGSCQVRAVSGTSWLAITSGPWVPAGGKVSWLARANQTGSRRSGTIAIGGSTITITQASQTAPPTVNPIGVDVADARYSRALNRLILAAREPRELGIYDPATAAYQAIALPIVPEILSLSPDGLKAAVISDGWLSQIDLTSGTVERTVEIRTDPGAARTTAEGYIYLFPNRDAGIVTRVSQADGTRTRMPIVSGIDTYLPPLYGYQSADVSPDGTTFYVTTTSELHRLEVSGDTLAFTGRHGGTCGGFWLNEGGDYGMSKCAVLHHVLPDLPAVIGDEVSYRDEYGLAFGIDWADHSSSLHATAMTGSVGMIFVGNDTSAVLTASQPVPTFVLSSGRSNGMPRYVFWGHEPTRLITVAQALPPINTENGRYGVFLSNFSEPAPDCTFQLLPSTILVPAAPSSGHITVTTGTACLWESASDAPWLTIVNAHVGRGQGTLSYSVAPNPTASARQGTLSSRGQTVTIIQAAGTVFLAPEQVAVSITGASELQIEVRTDPENLPWTAIAQSSWITVLGPTGGSGNGVVRYSIAANPGPSERTGTIRIGNATFTVRQTISFPPPLLLNPSVRGSSMLLRWVTQPPGKATRLMVARRRDALPLDPASTECGECVLNVEVASDEYLLPDGILETGPVFYWQVSAREGAFAGVWSQTGRISGAPPGGPLVIFRTALGELTAIEPGRDRGGQSGGKLTGEPTAARHPLTGEVWVAARDDFDGLWLNSLSADGNWRSWHPVGGVVQGSPAIAVADDGTVYVAVRDRYGAYWLVEYSPATAASSWRSLGGVFSSDPAVAVSAEGALCLVGRDPWGGLWSMRRSANGELSSWSFGGGITTGQPSVAFGPDGYAHIAARDSARTIWVTAVGPDRNWTPWQSTGGLSESSPQILPIERQTRLLLAIVDPTGATWTRSFDTAAGNASNWGPWKSYGGIVTSMTAMWTQNELTIAGLDSLGNLWWNAQGSWVTWAQPGRETGALTAPR